MLTILDPDFDQVTHKNQYGWFFDVNNDEYDYCKAADYKTMVDILVANSFYNPSRIELDLYKNYNYRSMIMFDLHVEENQAQRILNRLAGSAHDLTFTSAYDPAVDHPRIVYLDYLYNMTKSYYENYPFKDSSYKLHYSQPVDYVAVDHPDADQKHKVFVSTNTTYRGTDRPRKYRTQLVDLLQSFNNVGYIGSVDSTPPRTLFPQSERPWCNDVTELERGISRHRPIVYAPPHREYYRNTFISIYGESIEYGNTVSVTEKTFSPLIMGHFILPYSTAKFIDRLKNYYGFAFPTFIDYGYDNITNDEHRWLAYSNEVKRLLGVGLDQWRQWWFDNKCIIEYNKALFKTRPYQRLDLENLLGSSIGLGH